ncbi:FAD-dependent oxidoreductase, partial [Burkholderia pyrrocinia]
MSDEQTDVIVIGAGIVGAACAHAFALRGLRVLVL